MLRSGLFLVLIHLFLAMPWQAQAGKQKLSTPLPALTVTLQGEKFTVKMALEAIQKQTGIAVADRRINLKEDLFSLNLKEVTFWQALDKIATKAQAAVSLYQEDGVLALVDGTPATLVSQHGIFSANIKRVTTSKDLETGFHLCQVDLTLAWQPNFEPFLLELTAYEAVYNNGTSGKTMQIRGKGKGQVRVDGRRAMELDVRFPAPDRSVTVIQKLDGIFSIIGPTKMLSLTYKDLPNRIKNGTSEKYEKDGVTVTLREVAVLDKNHWVVEFELIQPKDGPKFESFQSWLVNNKIWLTNQRDDKIRFVPRSIDEELIQLTSNEAVVRYHFLEYQGSPRLGDPGDWILHYRTPARIVQTAVPFHFTTVPLP